MLPRHWRDATWCMRGKRLPPALTSGLGLWLFEPPPRLMENQVAPGLGTTVVHNYGGYGGPGGAGGHSGGGGGTGQGQQLYVTGDNPRIYDHGPFESETDTRKKIINWIAPLNFAPHQQEIYETCHKDTLEWFL
ncbi:hypothetical protein MIND_01228400 [Mycena indigotica]|uniref:Uncharacterized protein n=1 Tax=Mycena indigotica TaxID=2126181 RepID=A0A8H6S3F0_9AGAR|nr:uncharacterized protein MIND_01228400 [Mycena indigotica]KAF7292026.1 hypothetical protein MIND_01228400 [Mycena indigotica]